MVNREIKSAKSNYYCNLINDVKGDSGKVWKAVNEASSHNVISLSPQCIVTGVQLTTPSLIAAAMNSHFASIGKTLADKISSVVSIVLPTSTMSLSQPAPVFNLNYVGENTVLQHLLSLKTNKAIGLDSISARLLRWCTCNMQIGYQIIELVY